MYASALANITLKHNAIGSGKRMDVDNQGTNAVGYIFLRAEVSWGELIAYFR
jgi:hypothetical protein